VKRRQFLKGLSAGTVAAMASQLTLKTNHNEQPIFEDFDSAPTELAQAVQYVNSPAPDLQAYLESFKRASVPEKNSSQKNLQNYIAKMKSFDEVHPDDIFVDADRYRLLLATFKRLDRVQNLVGYGNFNVLSFDEMLAFSRRYSSVGGFTLEELDFLEEVFFNNAEKYGFFGEKVVSELTSVVPEKERLKVPFTGHFIYRGESLKSYHRVRKDVGDSVILTSGIRSVVKQTHLFLAKTIESRGNFSKASRSLAPPGHSFHAVGDYDVGKVGFGRRNFTSDFASTEEFQKLVDLGYINMRYPDGNLLGVRFEPWHIKVV
jgi:D-alanyl-D-alanine carboxypeptidase